ncbi:cellulose 1,4-beta-cellobiosidase [Xylaria sp. CBS 124048]|nr:cellulose 1,4-beta-cellobiosidase [Xylaria sp. CBS 124048]
MHSKLAAIAAFVATAKAQCAGTITAETHPSLSWQQCSDGGDCTTVQGSVVIDSNWRWVHDESGTNCYTGNEWDASICSDADSCATTCCVDGADYEGTYGITVSDSAMTLKFVTQSEQANVGSRLYLLKDESTYQDFQLLGNEFTFDVDVSELPCGLNGALYFVSMDLDGGEAAYPSNTAGAKYGTGYCDSQCARDLKFIGGKANIEGWAPSTNDPNSGIGDMGACCSEMDIWEANSISTAVTPHPCTDSGYHVCESDDCGGTYSSDRFAGDCDPDGCDFNSYRMGDTTFYGPSMTVDTTQPITVVTQFLADGGSLSEIKRFYVQGGTVIPNSESTISGVTGNSITEDFCDAQKTAFGDDNIFDQRGGFSGFSDALSGDMVLVMSLWDDHAADMLWLDSTYPTNSTSPGAARGTCATDSGVPSDVESQSPNAQVTYSNIKFGPINSTFTAA